MGDAERRSAHASITSAIPGAGAPAFAATRAPRSCIASKFTVLGNRCRSQSQGCNEDRTSCSSNTGMYFSMTLALFKDRESKLDTR